MTEEEKKAYQEIAESNNKMFQSIIPQLPIKENPRFRKAFGNSKLYNASYDDRQKILNTVREDLFEKYKEFRDAWVDVFGGVNVKVMKDSNNEVLKEYMLDVFRFKDKSDNPGFAKTWLKSRLMKDLYKERIELG